MEAFKISREYAKSYQSDLFSDNNEDFRLWSQDEIEQSVLHCFALVLVRIVPIVTRSNESRTVAVVLKSLYKYCLLQKGNDRCCRSC
jgi:hypothetical protein